MTISANSTFAPDCDAILRSALQKAGLLALGREPSAQQLSHARTFFDEFLKSLDTKGPVLMQMERTTLALTANEAEYNLATDTVEVTFPLMVKPTGSTGSETQISPMTYKMYQEMPSKDQTGVPIRCYVEKLAVVTLRFWPVPDVAYTVSYQRQRLLRNADSGSTLDLTARWQLGVSFQLAAFMALAGSLDIGKVRVLQGYADDYLTHAHGRENEGQDVRMILPGSE